MADFLLELFSEEIPARMQGQAAKDLERLVVGALSDRGLLFEGVKAFAGPRRLTLAISGLPAKQPDVKEEKKGPRVTAPEKAIEGFLRSAGVTIEQCQKQNDGKGEFYVAVIDRKGRATADVLAEFLPETLAKLPWPKSMRWPQEIKPSTFGTATFGKSTFGANAPVRWVRPLHCIVATLDGEVVPFEFAGVKSGNTTMGHRFLSSGPIEVRRFDDYVEKLRKGHVVLDADERKEIILHEAKQKAFALSLELIDDQGLLEEVAGLAEWPVVLLGTIGQEFMDLPPEILQTSMRTHQKYFSLRDSKTGKFANRFAVVANMIAEDGGKEIVAGNERVLRARLSDAKFFWDQDRKRTLESRVDDLKNIVFHAKLGTQYERVERIRRIAVDLSDMIGSSTKETDRAALLCKADLVSGLVGEFPELQGVIGRYLALNDRENLMVADAVEEHYLPRGAADVIPKHLVSVSVALADKIDILSAFAWLGEMPTGSSDPYALRRSAIGIVRIILGNGVRQPLLEIFESTLSAFSIQSWGNRVGGNLDRAENALRSVVSAGSFDKIQQTIERHAEASPANLPTEFLEGHKRAVKLVEFVIDRLKVALREKGTRHDLIDAVFSLGNEDDLVRLVARVEALQSFLKTDEGANLLAGYKRAANILKAEEKKDKTTFDGAPDAKLLKLPEEKALADALAKAETAITADVQAEKFVEAMTVMAQLRKPVDAFFEKVTVNDKDASLRANRLKLLARLRATLHLVADFSKIEG